MIGGGSSRPRCSMYASESLHRAPTRACTGDGLYPRARRVPLAAQEAEHSYWALFHLGSEEAQAGERSTIRTMDADRANLQLIPLGEAPVQADVVHGQEQPFLLGWTGTHRVGNKHPIPVARFEWKQTGISRMMYVLWPTRPKDTSPAPTVERLDAGGNAFGAKLHFADGREDLLGWASGEGGFSLDGTVFDARAAVVRKRAEGEITGVIQVGR